MNEADAVAAVARNVAADMRRMEVKCWHGGRMGEFAVALMLDGFASRLEGAYNRPPRKEGEMSDALRHCGYEGMDMEDGSSVVQLSAPFEGATIEARLYPLPGISREWVFTCQVMNNLGGSWGIRGSFHTCGRYIAKSMLRSMALELRRLYCHRNARIHKAAIARAKAKAEREGGAK